MYIYFYRTDLALIEYNFTINFCQVVIEKYGFKVRVKYGTHTVQIKVHLKCCNIHKLIKKNKQLGFCLI